MSYAGEKDLWECDFVTASHAIQVCANLTEHNQKREIQGAVRAAALPGKRRAMILTLDQRDSISADGTAIEVIPAWDWLASDQP